jgi:serine/threonine protein kinase
LNCIKQIHEKGVVHNDFHPMNVMRNAQGQLVVIDFGRSGRVGDKISMEKRSPWWPAELYSFEADHVSLNKFFCMFLTPRRGSYPLPCRPHFSFQSRSAALGRAVLSKRQSTTIAH